VTVPHLLIAVENQQLQCYIGDVLYKSYPVSTGKNGSGQQSGSGCTPLGLHCIHNIIGLNHDVNSVFVGREWTGEYYTPELAASFPDRDWILTRILQLDGLEEGYNRGGEVDTLSRFIYIHGTPDSTALGMPGSHGCIRMRNSDIVELALWVQIGTRVSIQ
jgi:lipoprotein-anchoring transpeptidase ErfK/SrfK